MRRKQFLAIFMSAALAFSSTCPVLAADASGADPVQSAAVEEYASAEASDETDEAGTFEESGQAVEASASEDLAGGSASTNEADVSESTDEVDTASTDDTDGTATTDDADGTASTSDADDSASTNEADGTASTDEGDDIGATNEGDGTATTNEDASTDITSDSAAMENAEEASAAEMTAQANGDAAAMTGVKLDRHTLTMKIGESAQLNASAEPENTAHAAFFWETGDSGIATVDQSGQITAVGIGTTTIYVHSEDFDYSDSCELKVTKINLSGASVLRVSGKRPYTGGKIQPVPVVKLDGVTLQEGTDYKVNYSRNTNVGTATCIITGQNNYSGTVKRTFEIVKAPNRFTRIASGGITLPLSLMNASLDINLSSKAKFDAKMTYGLVSVPSSAKKYIKLSSGGKLSIKKGIKAGTYKIKIKVTAAETKNSKKATGTKEIKIVLKNHMKQYESLSALGVKGYSKEVDKKVNAAFDAMIVDLNGQGIKYSRLSDYEKAYIITLHIGSTYSYKDGSYNAESMLDKGYGTCFAYSDLTYLMAKKAGLKNSWLTVPGRNVNHNGKTYGSQHRSVVTKIGKDYYELDSNGVNSMLQFLAYGFSVDLTPEKISESYAKYLIGKAKTFKTIN